MTRLASLRGRLLRQFLLIGVLPVLLVSGAAVMLVSPALEAQADARNRDLARTLRDQMQLQLQVRSRAASLLASQLEQPAPDPARTELALQSLLQGDDYVQAAFVVDSRGIITSAAMSADSGRFASDVIGADLSAQPYFQAARSRDEPTWSDTFLSTLSGQVTAVLAAPASDRSVVVELSLAGLSESLSALAVDDGARTVVLDRRYRVIAHPDPAMALRQESLANLSILRAGDPKAEAGATGITRINGLDYFAHALAVPVVGWTVLALQPVSQVMAPLRGIGAVLALLLAAVVAAAGGLGWLYSRRTGREVEALADGAQLAATSGQAVTDRRFTTSEFERVWRRLHDLFQQLHLRDQQTQAARGDLQAVLDAATEVSIIATDLDGRVTMFNIGAQRMLGRSEAEVVGRLTPLSWHDADEVGTRAVELNRKYGITVSPMEALITEARHGGYEVRDWTYIAADGRRLEVSLAVTSVRSPAGDLKGFLGVAVDVTERRRAAELELQRKSAELANQAKSDFLSRVSHELRTPLNAILGYAQLLTIDRQEPPTEGQSERLGHIQTAGWHLVQLIEDVLDLSRIESGSVRVSIEPLDLAPIVQRACELVGQGLEQRGVELKVEWAAAARVPGSQVLADATRLTQILVNLLDNAGKYNQPGGQVTLRCDVQDGHWRIAVSDTGRGMSDTQLQRLFQPFDRLGLEGSAISGTGIGLVISRRLVDLMKGSLSVRSEVGIGSTFALELPLAGQAGKGSMPTPATAPLPPGSTWQGRVLYIEDNELNGQLMRAVYRQRPQIKLVIAKTIAEGLSSAKSQCPDVFLLDMHLPDGTGSELMARLASDPDLSQVPIIVISADATAAQKAKALDEGAYGYLTKPINIEEVLQLVDSALEVSGRSRLAEAAPGPAQDTAT